MARGLPGNPQSRPARIVLAILRPKMVKLPSLQHELVYWAQKGNPEGPPGFSKLSNMGRSRPEGGRQLHRSRQKEAE
jgi:hypothetical protein